MKKLIKGMIMVLLAVFMLISNANASAWDVYGTVTGASEGTEIGIWRINCGGMLLIADAIPTEDGIFEFDLLGKGEYLIQPLNDEVNFDPGSMIISVPQNKTLEFVVVE